jgi:hypothetical protein
MGFIVGLVIMFVATRVFVVNSFDFENMQRGVRLILSGVNPWAAETRIPHFYNPPFAVLFLWPMLFTSSKVFIVIGGALLFAFLFYNNAWVAFAWFSTNSFLWVLAAGSVDMFVMGSGLLLLAIGDKAQVKWQAILVRVLAYGILMVKPQGTIFIVLLYILTRRDWIGSLISVLIYGVAFIPLYPDWFFVLLNDPPLAQTVASQTIFAKFGMAAAILLALLIVCSRNWKYWELGGALAGILMPYGMPGLPILLILSGVRQLKVIPIFILYSGFLAVLTWIPKQFPLVQDDYNSHLMSIYHLSMMGLALVLSIMGGRSAGEDTIAVNEWLKQVFSLIKKRINP